LPKVDYYEDFPQFENGVGMLALFESDFRSEIREQIADSRVAFSVATGFAAAPMFERILKDLPAKVYAVRNDFFGDSVDVAGLITGRDLIAQLKGKDLGEFLVIPSVMLRRGGDLFLDSISLDDAKRELGVPIFAVENDGRLFAEKIAEISR
ncbi:MAG: DUF512 domain-containing protein, partial [Oscillospiraceae bacterium]|nr:DUF512 domain-containing protein [Oscillospiraceae bacterium]